MTITILTLFPEMFVSPFNSSIIKRAVDRKFLKLETVNIRDFANDRYKTVDDHPYGGGVGMVMKVDILDRAIEKLKIKNLKLKIKERIVLLDPAGKVYNQKMARKYSGLDHLILIAGHYEGYDQRIENFVDESVSVGDYVLTGGEIPSMVIVDSVTRLIPGVLKSEATENESFSNKLDYNLLEPPQFTRPEDYKGFKVPEVLLSGNHKEIVKWREREALKRTEKIRDKINK
ncbi:MAG: tRNA (guanine-N(1)-)-methyltransferase [Candidatus Gottesmanbacteria bacterium GW2011_GWC2_39_8]|uniref:tRNA (guanine-N(1)-)-methyltransferase n=1 Tax=Candidatus Gottesmanbacteria bacterium GW2011_GWC2_39_8 TaxID=1618450 RepID=A0A0G0PWD7_9BACT|nr:MAG: tRNA (guanine-N(1)-)-methyltransferase [Candidatus Gottesmanbacteria bacterium GW2011_GWC2_39_8]